MGLVLGINYWCPVVLGAKLNIAIMNQSSRGFVVF